MNKKNKVSKTQLVQKHLWKVLVISLFVFVVAGFVQNKRLNTQNVDDMNQLLAEFEKLEKSIEADTGDDLEIEASCGSVGKFATSYSCALYLKNSKKLLYEYDSYIDDNPPLSDEVSRCRVISGRDAGYSNFYTCTLSVRDSNREAAESIFYRYDTSPGSPF